MPRPDPKQVSLPPLSVQGALTLGNQLLAVAEPIEDQPAFISEALYRLDDAVRALRGAVQYRRQLDLAYASRQQRLRAEVNVAGAHHVALSALRSHVLRVADIVDEQEPSTLPRAQALLEPVVAWELRYGAHVDHRPSRRVLAARAA